MGKRGTPSQLTLATIRKTIEKEVEDNDNEALLEAASLVVGAVMVIGGVLTAGLAALGFLGGKNELFKVATALMGKSRKRRHETTIERHQRMLTAHQLLVYAAFLEAAGEILDFINEHSSPDNAEVRFSTLALEAMGRDLDAPIASHETSPKAQLIIQAPHPAESLEEYGKELHAFYSGLASRLSTLMSRSEAIAAASKVDQARIRDVLAALATNAIDNYNAHYFALSADNPQFQTWMHIRHTDMTARSLERLPDVVAQRVLDAISETPGLDVGLRKLGTALPAAQRRHRAGEVVDELARKYKAVAAKPIVSEQSFDAAGPALSYPSRREAFIPQAFQVLRTRRSIRLEEESSWADVPPREDLSEFLLAYLRSSHSTSTPLVIVGDPGSGKSLLSQMIAGHAGAQDFTPIRLELRNVDVTATIYKQLERQIRDDTHGQEITWADLNKELVDTPPVAIYDGFDELLLTSGTAHASFLEDIKDFQSEERDLGREFRAIVTSRITLIDRATVPSDSTVIRLLDFDDRRQREWIEIWNGHNAANFDQTKKFELPNRPDIHRLAGKPLLLFLLALFDAHDNPLRDEPGVDRAKLYNDLLTSFVKRQRIKEASGKRIADTELAEAVTGDMRRLGIAAMSMFNRRTLHVERTQLERDLAFFDSAPADHLSSDADFLFGRFFFVHESRSRAPGISEETDRPAAYEFLHDTFGEFLTADFILRRLVEQVMMERQPLSSDASTLPEKWFGTLIHTAVYTRPVMLAMMRSWFKHLLKTYELTPRRFTAQLDTFVRAQITSIINGLVPPTSFNSSAAPYDMLPLMGHYAIYTLNLILLRVVVSDEPLVLDGRGSGAPEETKSQWEQLTHLWRGWMSVDDLAAVAAIMEARHVDGDLHVRAREPSIDAPGTERLETTWLAASALGDRLTVALLGVHLYDAGDRHPIDLESVREDLQVESVDLDLELLMREVRSEGWPRDPELVMALGRYARRAVALESTSRSHRDLLVALTSLDAPPHLRSEARRAMRSPRFTDAMWSAPDSFGAAYVRFCASVVPRWAVEIVAVTLRREAPERLARRAPEAFAACLDVAYPAGGPIYVVSGYEDAEWLDPVIRGLLSHELDPVVIVALLDLATRIAPYIGESELVDACKARMLDEKPLTGLSSISVSRLRRLIIIADESADDELAGWLVSGTELLARNLPSARNLPADLVLDIDRLRLVSIARTRIDRETVDRWPLLRGDADVAALSRLCAWLEPDAERGEGTSFGRDTLLAYLADPEAPGVTLGLTPGLVADLTARTGVR